MHSESQKNNSKNLQAGVVNFAPVNGVAVGSRAGESSSHNRLAGNDNSRVSLQLGARLSAGAPETRDLTFSFLPLSDAAPFIVAHRKGWFAAQGINSTLRRESSWTALRDALNRGTAHAAQMLFSMPIAAACGLLGADQPPLVIPWVINRNGQAITLKKSYQGASVGRAEALRKQVNERRDAGRPFVFGHTLRIGTHALWLRYWLAAGGIDPDRDVALITVPPPQMVKNMRVAAMDGFCVGEPWNARALSEGLGFTAITSQEIWPDHPEKVCAFTEAFAQKNPRTVVAVLKALHQASLWLDDPANHDAAAELLGTAENLNCEAPLIRSRFGTALDFGDGQARTLSHALSFSERGANCPRSEHALWFLSQLRRWGLHYGAPDYQTISARVIRGEFYQQAMEELGGAEAEDLGPAETLCDSRKFDATDPEGYARSFEVKNIQG